MVTMDVYTWRGDVVTYYFAARDMADSWASLFKPQLCYIYEGVQLDMFWKKVILGNDSNDEKSE